MPEHSPSPEFTALAPSRRARGTLERSSEPEMPLRQGERSGPLSSAAWGFEEVRDRALQLLWPLLYGRWVEIQDKAVDRILMIKSDVRQDIRAEAIFSLEEEFGKWAAMPFPGKPERAFLNNVGRGEVRQIAWNQFFRAGCLMGGGTHSILREGDWSPQLGRHTGIRETLGTTRVIEFFIWRDLENLESVLTLEEHQDWPAGLDMESLWLAGSTDMGGDHLLLVQGTQGQLLEASRSMLQGRFRGEPVNITLNGSIQQHLSLEQALLLMPAAMMERLVILDQH